MPLPRCLSYETPLCLASRLSSKTLRSSPRRIPSTPRSYTEAQVQTRLHHSISHLLPRPRHGPGTPHLAQCFATSCPLQHAQPREDAQSNADTSPPVGIYRFIGGKRKLIVPNSVRERMEKQEKKLLQDIDSATTARLHHGLHTMLNIAPDEAEDGDTAADFMYAPWEGEDLDPSAGPRKLKIGDLVELRDSRLSPGVGIYLRRSQDGGRTADILHSEGTIKKWNPNRVAFYIPGFSPADKLHHINEYLDQITAFEQSRGNEVETKELVVPTNITNPILHPVRTFAVTAEKAQRRAFGRFKQLYPQLAKYKSTETVTTEAAAEFMFGRHYSAPELYAAHCLLMADGLHFRANKGLHRNDPVFRIASVEFIQNTERVTGWIRESKMSFFDSETALTKEGKTLRDFVDKARYLIDKSRQIRKSEPSDRNVLVEEVPVPDMKFTATDEWIISYLKAQLQSYGLQPTAIEGLAPFILRATKRYEGQTLDVTVTYQFLTEIGVYSPWENLGLHQETHKLPLFTDHDPYKRVFGQEFGDLELRDTMKSFRKDWGDLPVFAIDSADTREVDDGISIEKVTEKESWIHVHISNPTAFLSTDHWIAKEAAARAATKYFHPLVVPMLPPAVSGALGVDGGGPVMTFSAKVDLETGDIVDFDVRLGIVRNVHRLTYEQATRALGGDPSRESSFLLEVGTFSASEQSLESGPSDPLPLEVSTHLKTLQKVAFARRRSRIRNGMCSLNVPEFSVQVDPGIGTPEHMHAAKKPLFYRGHPAIRLHVDTPLPVATDSHALVMELMLTAGSVVSRFAVKHNIPVPFQTLSFKDGYPKAVDVFQNVLLPQRDEYGNLPDPYRCGGIMARLGSVSVQTEPAPHQMLGLGNSSSYVKATSPLRRYMDMMVHWNLQAHLAGQKMPFPKELLRQEMTSVYVNEKWAHYGSSDSRRFWGTAALKRALEIGVPLPPRFSMVVVEKHAQDLNQNSGLVKELGMMGKLRLRSPREAEVVQVGDVVEVEIVDVKLAERMVTFESRGLIEKIPDMYKL